MDTTKSYRIEADLTAVGSTNSPCYMSIKCIDAEGWVIAHWDAHHYSVSRTTLAADLKSGDTVVQLTDGSGWNVYGTWYQNMLTFTNQARSYAPYTRMYVASNYYLVNGNQLTLCAYNTTTPAPYQGATIPAGTPVAQGYNGASYNYSGIIGSNVSTTETHYVGNYTGEGTNNATQFRPGTHYVSPGLLANYGKSSDYNSATRLRNFKFYEVV